MKILYSVLFSVMLVLGSCEYEPTGEYTPDIKEPQSAPPLMVDLNAAGDTILVDQFSVLEFKFQTDDKELYWVKYCIGNHCETGNSSDGIYRIFMGAHNVMPGKFNLTLEVFTETGTGSIADILGTEGFLYSKKFTLIVVEKLDGIKLVSVTPDNGSLKLSWEKYEFSDFLEYTIVKSNGYSSEIVAVINNQHITSVYDDSYIGGKAEYRVNLKTNSRDFEGISTSYEDGFPEVLVQESDKNSFTLSWGKSKYINNIKGYEIYVLYNGYELVAEITDPDVTSYVLSNLRFLFDNEIFIRFVPKILPTYYYLSSDFLSSKASIGYIGDKFEAGPVVTPLGDFLYFQRENFIHEYNYTTEEVTNTIELSTSTLVFSVSPNRKYILIDKATMSESVILYNINTKEIKEYSWSQFSDVGAYVQSVSVSDNGKAVFGLANKVLVYDFLNEKKIFEGEIYPLNTSVKISADGKYFYSTGQVYEIHTDNILLAAEITNEIQYCSFFDFHMNDPDLFVYSSHENIYVKRISDLSTVSELYVTWTSYVFNIDYNANQVLIYKEDRLRVYDIVTWEEVSNYPVSYFGIHLDSVRYCNNKVYDSYSGLRLKISQN